jgi:hypothetical protein
MSSKQRNLRKKRDREEASDSEEPGVEVKKDYLEDLKAVQKLRKRTAGINAGALASGTSGDADAQAAAAAAASMADNELMDAYVRAQGAKSALQDEEAHMQQFVERELAKRLGKDLNDGAQQLSKHELEEQELYAVPEALKASLTKEVSIPGLITAITEVEMSKEAKMKKIEETEAMKQKMLARGMGRWVLPLCVQPQSVQVTAITRWQIAKKLSSNASVQQQDISRAAALLDARGTSSPICMPRDCHQPVCLLQSLNRCNLKRSNDSAEWA